MDKSKKIIENGGAILGIELGSTRIKAVAIDETNTVIASGDFAWENDYVDGIWTYSLDKVKLGLATAYANLKKDIFSKYGIKVKSFAAFGVSAMMHGYLVFDKDMKQLAPFKTWRNNITHDASKELMELFNYPIPQRWSIAHLYQCILNGEKHVLDIDYMTTLAGYVHVLLSGEKVLGVCDASAMFPVDINAKDYDKRMLELFTKRCDEKAESLGYENGLNIDIVKLLPKILVAGENAGALTETGAKLLDKDGDLKAGIPMCPPEGDAGTGMVATASVKKRTGNVSAGTSVFAMVVLEKELSKPYEELDLMTTPAGNLVAMAHSNNCTSNLDAWMNLFNEVLISFDCEVSKSDLYKTLYNKALDIKGDTDSVMSYGYVSGEHMTGFTEGRPLLVRKPEAKFDLARFMRANLFSTLGALKIGLDILLKDEGVKLDKMYGHGGFFKTKDVGQIVMSCATGTDVAVNENAGEGGAWGIALLAAFMKDDRYDDLGEFLDKEVFTHSEESVLKASEEQMKDFEDFMQEYKNCLAIERAAVEVF